MKLDNITKEMVVDKFNGNPKDLAKDLNLSLTSVYHLIKKYDLKTNFKKIEHTEEEIRELFKNSLDAKQISEKLNVGIGKVYEYLKKYNLRYLNSSRISKEELEKLYAKESARMIGKRYGVSGQCVFNWLEYYGIATFKKGKALRKKEIPFDRELVLKTYLECKSIKKLAEKLKVKEGTARAILNKLGISILPMGARIKVEDEVLVEYFNQGLTYKEIAVKCGLHQITVIRRLGKIGLRRNEKELWNTTHLTKEFFEQNKNKTIRQLSKELDVCVPTLQKYKKKARQ